MAKLLRWLHWQKPVSFSEQPSVAQRPLPSSPVSQKAHISCSRGRFDSTYRQTGNEGVQSTVRVWGKQRTLLFGRIICLLCAESMGSQQWDDRTPVPAVS